MLPKTITISLPEMAKHIGIVFTKSRLENYDFDGWTNDIVEFLENKYGLESKLVAYIRGKTIKKYKGVYYVG